MNMKAAAAHPFPHTHVSQAGQHKQVRGVAALVF
jgi:hypothetical protein